MRRLRQLVRTFLPQQEMVALCFTRWRQWTVRHRRAKKIIKVRQSVPTCSRLSILACQLLIVYLLPAGRLACAQGIARVMWPSVSVEQAFRAWLRWVGQRLQFRRTAQLRRVLLEERQRQRQLAAVQRYIDQRLRDGADEQLRLDIPAILAADPDLQRRDPVEDELAFEAQQPSSPDDSEDEDAAAALPAHRSADQNKIALIHALRKQRQAEKQLQKVSQLPTNVFK
jgi:hypothetical protein